jgi:hypothetical protein
MSRRPASWRLWNAASVFPKRENIINCLGNPLHVYCYVNFALSTSQPVREKNLLGLGNQMRISHHRVAKTIFLPPQAHDACGFQHD